MDFLFPPTEINLQLWVEQLVARRRALDEIADFAAHDIAEHQFALYILSGIDKTDADHEKQVSVTVMEDALIDSGLPVLRRDYDSLLIFSDTIPYERELFVYPIPRREDTLLESLHLKVKMTVTPGEDVRKLILISVTAILILPFSLLYIYFLHYVGSLFVLTLFPFGPGPIRLIHPLSRHFSSVSTPSPPRRSRTVSQYLSPHILFPTSC